MSDLLQFFKDNLPKLIYIVTAVVLLSYSISLIALILADFLPSNENASTLTDLSVNSIFVAVTSIYVLATFGILTRTEESIKQNEKNIENTLRAQQIAYVERKLEYFYYPLFGSLKYSCIDQKQLLMESLESFFHYTYLVEDPTIKSGYTNFRLELHKSSLSPEELHEIQMELFGSTMDKLNEIEHEYSELINSNINIGAAKNHTDAIEKAVEHMATEERTKEKLKQI